MSIRHLFIIEFFLIYLFLFAKLLHEYLTNLCINLKVHLIYDFLFLKDLIKETMAKEGCPTS
jgi:hypothetical protein